MEDEVSGRKSPQLDAVASSSQPDSGTFCDECQWKDGNFTAGCGFCIECNAFLCTKCLKSHRSNFASKDHNILEGDGMPKSKPTKTRPLPVTVSPEHECVDMCKIHPRNLLKYYCDDHKQLSCSDCMALDHTACKEKVLVSTISCQLENQVKVSRFFKKVSQLKEVLESDQELTKSDFSSVSQCYSKASKEIDEFQQKISRALSSQSEKLKTEAGRLRDEDISKLKTAEVTRASLLQEVDLLSTEADSLMKLNKKAVLFSSMLLEGPRIESWYHERFSLNASCKVGDYNFRSNDASLTYFDNMSSVGALVLQLGSNNEAEGRTMTADPQTASAGGRFLCECCVQELVKYRPTCNKCGVIGKTMTEQSQSGSSDYDRKIRAMNERLQQLNSEANKLILEKKREKRKLMNYHQKTLKKQIEAYDNTIVKLKDDLDNGPYATATVRPPIKHPDFNFPKALKQHEITTPKHGSGPDSSGADSAKMTPIIQSLKGNQPSGTMSVCHLRSALPGYPAFGTIFITYCFPPGVQKPEHPSPGMKYRGVTRETYLPYNQKGEKVLRLLKVAFDRQLLFTIGTSKTTGREGIIWNNAVHHKTYKISTLRSEERFGYPDPFYLDSVKQELAALGVTEKYLKDNCSGQRESDVDRPIWETREKREQMLEAQEMFKNSNKVTRPEKALILGFMAGSRDNPFPQQGNILSIRLSENKELVAQADTTQKLMNVDTFFQMNYLTGEWKRVKKLREIEEG